MFSFSWGTKLIKNIHEFKGFSLNIRSFKPLKVEKVWAFENRNADDTD